MKNIKLVHLEILVIAVIFLASLAMPAQACERYGSLRFGAGWAGSFDPDNEDWKSDNELAAHIEAGYHVPLSNCNWWMDAKIGHHSNYFVGDPFNSDEEATLDYVNVGIEWRF